MHCIYVYAIYTHTYCEKTIYICTHFGKTIYIYICTYFGKTVFIYEKLECREIGNWGEKGAEGSLEDSHPKSIIVMLWCAHR